MSILLLESIHEDAHSFLNKLYDMQFAGTEYPLPEAIQCSRVEAIITRGRGRITPSLMQQCPQLKAIARCGAGLDNLDVAYAKQTGIPVVFAPGKTAPSVAEHTMMLMLSLARRLPYLAHEVRMGNWAARSSYEGVELRGKTLGLIGMGSIGLAVANLATAFGMHVIYWSRSQKQVEFPCLELNDVLTQADFISLHTALNDETRGLIGVEQFAKIRPHAYLINTARGALVDEDSLLIKLNEGLLAGYATDLLTNDPPESDNPLLNHPRTLITPHSAVLTDRTYRDICMSVAKNVSAILQGNLPDKRAIYS